MMNIKILILDGIGDVYSSLGDFQKAVNYHKQSRILFSQAGEMTLESLSIGTIISIYRNFTGDYQQALVYIEEALALHRKAGDKEQEASTLNQKGDIYIRQGNYQLALDAYHQALEIERSITKNPRAEARTLGNIALLYNFLGDSNLSISHYNQVLDIYRKLDDKKQQARTFNYIGGVYQSNRKFDEALESYNQALRLFNKEDYQPLIVNHEIVNLPSVTAIATQRQELKGRKTAPKTLAILADPVFEATDTRITDKPESIVPNSDFRGNELNQSALKQAARNLNRNGWGRLQGTETEAKAILKLVPSNNLQAFGFNANYNWVTNPQLSQYRFLHFATHGFADPNNPELSGIVLSQFLDKQAKPADKGYLRLGDIFNLDFGADLIVLSACDTGVGKDVNGEGLVGLTRGLMYAGAERVAVSLWQVDDMGAPELMQEFYTQMLKQGKSPAVALRAAQLKLWENSSLKNPYYWSAFTLQGEWR